MKSTMQLKWTDLISLTKTGVDGIKSIAGVYRLIYHNGSDGKNYVYYVGQADNLNARLTQHLSANEENECCQKHLDKYTCYFRAAGISTQDDRNGAEVSLYNKFKPTCVERIPDVDPIEINFV